MALGVYLFLYAEKKNEIPQVLCTLSGILIGIGYLIRESALLIALFFAAYILYQRRLRLRYLLVPLGVLLVLVLEALVFNQLTGDPLYRTHASQHYLAAASAEHDFFGRLDFPTGLLHYPWLFVTNNLLNLFYVPAILGAALLLLRMRSGKDRDIAVMLLWFVPLGLYLSFGSSSFTQYLPFKAADRYTSIITYPMVLLLAFTLRDHLPFKRKGLMIIVGLLTVLSLLSIHQHGDRQLLSNLGEAYDSIIGEGKVIYVDDRSLEAIRYLTDYSSEQNARAYPETFEGIQDAVVVVNRHMIRNVLEANPKKAYPLELVSIPEHWQFRSDFGKEDDRISVYYLPKEAP